MMGSSRRLTVLISGNGTNLQALIDATRDGSIPRAQIVKVISNRKAAKGLERAAQAQIPTKYHNLLDYKKRHPTDTSQARSAYDEDLAQLVLADQPDLVVCAGFMHILAPSFLNPLEAANVEIVNLHPALPRQFDGIDAIERAHQAWLEGQISKTGAMIHKVIAEVDQGDPVLVQEIPLIKGQDEDLEVFKAKVHKVEWVLIVEGVKRALDGLATKS